MTAYIAKISEFNGEDIETSPQEWLDQVTKAEDANGWNAARMLRTIPYFLKGTAEQFTDNNTSITLQNCFCNIKQEPSKSVMTYIGKFNKFFRQIHQLETNDYYSDAQILDQFIAGLKDKLIKKVRPHVPEDLNSAIQHAKRYEIAMEEANYTKLMNLAIGETNSAAEEKIDQLTKKVKNYFTNQQQQQSQRQNQNNFTLFSNNQPQNCYYCGIPGHWKRDCRKLQHDQQNRIQPIPNHYHTQPSYFMMPEEQNFCHTALSESRAAAQQQNLSYTPTTIPPARITENANLSDIFPFKFEANKSPFLLSNAAANKQKAITAMYTKAEVEGKPIQLILNSESAGSIITYQLIQQLKRNVDRPAQTVIVTADDMKKTPSFVVHSTNAPKKPRLLNSNQKKKNPSLKHLWHLNQPPIGPMKLNNKKVKRGTPFNAAYNSALNKLYYYPYDAEMIFDLAMALINGATKEDVYQMKEAEYIEYIMKLARFDYEDKVEVYHQITRIKPEKAHEIDAGYDLKYPDKDILVLKPKFLTKINLKIALEIPSRAIVQIAFRPSLASKGINVRGGIIDAGYTGDITVILQNETDKPFKIEHAEKIVQAIYLPLINILGLQLVSQREQLGKNKRGTNGFGSTG
ncbi:hypothetical protein G9A89_015117 [Geosiphon pyriformis]|nr:hypothetical protein G9A89_015117 [Geosiphon pyriformis]